MQIYSIIVNSEEIYDKSIISHMPEHEQFEILEEIAYHLRSIGMEWQIESKIAQEINLMKIFNTRL